MQDLSKLPPGTIVHMSDEEVNEHSRQIALKGVHVMKSEPVSLVAQEQAATLQRQALAKPSAEEFARNFETYRQIQKTIDECMPDSIMDIQGKPFRKKAYWRAVATAFNLHVEPAADEYFEIGDNQPGRDGDWGYRIAYRATTSSGRVAYGDGTCMHSDKLVYDWEWKNGKRDKRLGVNKVKTEDNATHHNVRGHAHTRAYNRAVSNLVGFGEVSAEEMPMDAPRNQPNRGATGANRPSQASSGPWDGQLPVTFGKYKPGGKEGGENGKQWKDLPSAYLEWLLEKFDNQTAKDMAGKELGRRAKAEAGKDTVDAEELRPLPLPLDTPDGVNDPRLYDDDGYGVAGQD